MRRLTTALFVSAAVLFAADCDTLTRRPAPIKDVAHVEIDSNTGRLLKGGRKYRDGSKIRAVIVNKNPYRYKYSITQDVRPLDSAIALSFLNLIPGFSDLQQKLFGITADISCEKAAKEWSSFQDTLKRVEGLASPLLTIIKEHNEIQDAYQEFYEFTNIDPADSNQQMLMCQKAISLRPRLDRLLTLPDEFDQMAKKNLSSLQAQAKQLQVDFDNLKKAAGTDCQTAIDKARKDLATTEQSLKDVEAAPSKFAESKKVAKATAAVIDEVHASAVSFNEPLDVVEVDEASEVKITINRLNRRVEGAKSETIGPVMFEIGKSSIYLTGGIGFSTIPDQKIIRVAGLADDGKTVENRFGYETNSHFRPSALVLLNAPFWTLTEKGRGVSFGLATGLVLAGRGDSAEVEYLGGIGLGFLKDKVFLNFGFHAARIQKLSGNFRIGDKVPPTLQDPLPIEKNFRGGFMTVISFRIR